MKHGVGVGNQRPGFAQSETQLPEEALAAASTKGGGKLVGAIARRRTGRSRLRNQP
jgi:hypothetical protein